MAVVPSSWPQNLTTPTETSRKTVYAYDFLVWQNVFLLCLREEIGALSIEQTKSRLLSLGIAHCSSLDAGLVV